MARARRVRGIRPRQSLGENARRVIAVRLDEVLSWRRALDDVTLVQDLHDMRIAAKRLRYALEMFDVCFPAAKPLLKEVTGIQEDLGTIHDLDVLTALLRTRLQAIDAQYEAQAVDIMGGEGTPAEKSKRLRALLSTQARDRRRLGLLGLIGDKVVERAQCYNRFCERWGGIALDDFSQRVRQAVGLAEATQDARLELVGPLPHAAVTEDRAT